MKTFIQLISFNFLVSILCVVTQSNTVAAQATPAPTLAPSGVLSETTTQGYGAAKVAMPWGGDNSKTNSQAPVTGSVFKKSQREWTAKVFNNSTTDTYSVSIRVVQKGSNGSSVKSDSYSASLSPGESNERPISSALNAMNASLELVSWRKTKSTAVQTPVTAQ